METNNNTIQKGFFIFALFSFLIKHFNIFLNHWFILEYIKRITSSIFLKQKMQFDMKILDVNYHIRLVHKIFLA